MTNKLVTFEKFSKLIHEVFLKTSFFILLINGCFNPIFSFQKINHNTQIDSKNPNIIFYKDFLIANKTI